LSERRTLLLGRMDKL